MILEISFSSVGSRKGYSALPITPFKYQLTYSFVFPASSKLGSSEPLLTFTTFSVLPRMGKSAFDKSILIFFELLTVKLHFSFPLDKVSHVVAWFLVTVIVSATTRSFPQKRAVFVASSLQGLAW